LPKALLLAQPVQRYFDSVVKAKVANQGAVASSWPAVRRWAQSALKYCTASGLAQGHPLERAGASTGIATAVGRSPTNASLLVLLRSPVLVPWPTLPARRTARPLSKTAEAGLGDAVARFHRAPTVKLKWPKLTQSTWILSTETVALPRQASLVQLLQALQSGAGASPAEGNHAAEAGSEQVCRL